MKQTIQLLLLLSLFMFTQGCNQEEKKEAPATFDKNTTTLINIHGKTDKRLHLYFYTMYRPKYFPDGKVSAECQEILSHPITATKRGRLSYGGITIENQDEYNITLPIFNKTKRRNCTSTPVGISVRITRLHEKHKQYAVVPIYTDTPLQTTEESSGSGNLKVDYRAESLRKTGDIAEPPKYFHIKDGAKVECFTKRHGANHIYRTKTKEHLIFRCDLPYKGNAEWRDSIVDDSIHLDIIIDKNKNEFIQSIDRHKVIGKKEPFQEEKLNIFDKIKLKLGGKVK